MDDVGVVVVREERHPARPLEADRQALRDHPADVVEGGRGQRVEVGEVVGDREDVEPAAPVVRVVQQREAVLPGEGRDLLPGVVRGVADLREQDVVVGLPHAAPEVREAAREHPAIGHLEVHDLLDALALEGLQQAGGDHDRLAGPELLVDAGDDGRVEPGRLVQEDDRRVLPELGRELDRDADHPEERVQEVLARGVVGLVGGDPDRVAEAREEGVGPLERLAGHGRHAARRLHRPVRLADGAHQVGEAEERDLARLREYGELDLLGVAVEGDARERVHPASPVPARLHVLEVPHDRVALVGLQVLVRHHGVAGLGAGVDAVEDPRLRLEVEARVGEVLVPVRVLDDDLDLRVHRLRRPHDQALRGLLHQVEAEGTPAARALGLDVALGLRGREEEVVEDQLVEEARREADDLLDVLPVGRARVAELLELEALVGDQGDPARRLDPPALEEALGLQHGLAVVRDPAAVGLEVDLADLQVLREGLEVLLEPVALRHATDVVHPAVDGQLEVAVARGLGHGGRGQQGRRERGSPETASVEHLHPPRCAPTLRQAAPRAREAKAPSRRSDCMYPVAASRGGGAGETHPAFVPGHPTGPRANLSVGDGLADRRRGPGPPPARQLDPGLPVRVAHPRRSSRCARS